MTEGGFPAAVELTGDVLAAAVVLAEAVRHQRDCGREYKEALNAAASPWKAQARRVAGAKVTEANAAAQRALDDYEQKREEAGI